jgi:hypothetical protein
MDTDSVEVIFQGLDLLEKLMEQAVAVQADKAQT